MGCNLNPNAASDSYSAPDAPCEPYCVASETSFRKKRMSEKSAPYFFNCKQQQGTIQKVGSIQILLLPEGRGIKVTDDFLDSLFISQ
ncbi:hypothetical protein A4V03_06890 [Bacteroides caecimuris]|uniref:Uncharacterized protein n=1 Tax=Bacteroides caecimuris TaxID=1796613 RepID=A0A1C7H012_9BACE|nr:hypothetical protein A4V03_06890 [Bacteroides caecimuris]